MEQLLEEGVLQSMAFFPQIPVGGPQKMSGFQWTSLVPYLEETCEPFSWDTSSALLFSVPSPISLH